MNTNDKKIAQQWLDENIVKKVFHNNLEKVKGVKVLDIDKLDAVDKSKPYDIFIRVTGATQRSFTAWLYADHKDGYIFSNAAPQD